MSNLGISNIEKTECNVIVGVKYTANGQVVETQMDDGELVTSVTLQLDEKTDLMSAVRAGMVECAKRHIKAHNLL